MANEVWAKLGVDTSSVPADMAKATSAFSKGAQDIEKAAGTHGDNAGGKLVGGIEHRLLGARHLSGALATALGLNIEHIAEHITSVLVGGSKEAWKQMGEIADENAKLIEKKLELSLSPKALQDKRAKDVAKAAAAAQGAGGDDSADKFIKSVSLTKAFADNLTKIGQLFGVVRSEAEKGTEVQEKEKDLHEKEIAALEQKKQIEESHRKLKEHEQELALTSLNSTQLLAAYDSQKLKAQEEINSGKLSELEIDQKKTLIADLSAKKAAELNRMQQVKIDKDKETLRLQLSLNEAQRKRAEDVEDLANKKADRGKLTIGEIANLKPGASGPQFGEDTHVETFGLSAEQAAAKESAVEIQRLQKQAEGLRTSGDAAGANALFDQIGTKKQSLVDSGFAKSTEGDEFKHLEETIHKDNMEVQKILTEITDVAKGKLRNE